MAKIEFECVEQKMKDLTGYCKSYFADDLNPYKAEKLHDDDFNFISGMNFVLSYITDLFIDNRDTYSGEVYSETMNKITTEIAEKTIKEFPRLQHSARILISSALINIRPVLCLPVKSVRLRMQELLLPERFPLTALLLTIFAPLLS